MSLIGGLISGGLGLIADKKKNKRAKEQFALDKKLADQQIDISKYIQDLSKQLMARGSNMEDPYGGTSGYDAATGTYKTTLGGAQKGLQETSDAEEAARLTLDQAIRRGGLADFEKIRGGAVNQASSMLDQLTNFDRGIGQVDAGGLASRMRLDRQGAVNAGYDDAARAAQTLQTRTGSSAVGDALNKLAVDRVRAQAQIGDPEVEALQLAEGINQGRKTNLLEGYGQMADRGQSFYDAAFNPAPYAGIADAKNADMMKFDLSKFDIAQGGSGTAAAGIGNAAAGLRQGYNISEANRIHAPTAKFVSGADKALSDSLMQLIKGGIG
jgi:hypothetical protein